MSVAVFVCFFRFMLQQIDVFEMRGRSLGRIEEVVVRTDGSGLGADWQLDHVTGDVRVLNASAQEHDQHQHFNHVNFLTVTVLNGRSVKHQPVVFEYRQWLNARNLVVALKPTATQQQAPSASIIGKLRML